MSDDLDLLDRPSVCRLFGGTRPINPATLYRGIASGKFPAPVKIGPGMSRWLRNECESALRAIIAERDAAPLDAA
jgi:predicted DNA-binding transcriptional regulator AlpA